MRPSISAAVQIQATFFALSAHENCAACSAMMNKIINNKDNSPSTQSSLWQDQDSLELSLDRFCKGHAQQGGEKHHDQEESSSDEPPNEEAVFPPRTTTTNVSPRRVTFSRTGRSKKTLSLSSYTDQEKARCFYTHADYLEMRRQCIANIKRLQNQQAPRSGDSFRGLETKTTKGRVALKCLLDRAKLLVLHHSQEQQKRKQQEGTEHDWQFQSEPLALLYQSAAAECTSVAIEVGQQDEEQAREIHLTPSKDSSVTRTVAKPRKSKSKRSTKPKGPLNDYSSVVVNQSTISLSPERKVKFKASRDSIKKRSESLEGTLFEDALGSPAA